MPLRSFLRVVFAVSLVVAALLGAQAVQEHLAQQFRDSQDTIPVR